MRFDPNRSIMAGVPTSTLETWLLNAQTAYTNIALGSIAESVSYAQGNGRRSVTHTRANHTQLVALIMLLQRQLGLVGPRHALRPTFR